MNKATYRVNGRVVLRRIGEDVLLVPVSGPAATSGGRVYPLNETAEEIWNHAAKGAAPAMIVDDLVARYAVSHEEACMDVDKCLATFVSEGLLERDTV